MAKLMLTAVGDDRPGLVSALAKTVADQGGNWLESQMAHLAGKFAGIVLVEIPDDNLDAFRGDVQRLTGDGVLEVTVTGAGAPQPTTGEARTLHLVGHDRPGIVRQVSEVLAAHGVSIEELHTQTVEAPMAGGLLFEAQAVVRTPDALDADALRHALEGLANELMVDLELG